MERPEPVRPDGSAFVDPEARPASPETSASSRSLAGRVQAPRRGFGEQEVSRFRRGDLSRNQRWHEQSRRGRPRRRWPTLRVERHRLKARAGTSRAAGHSNRGPTGTHGMWWVGLDAARVRCSTRGEMTYDDRDGLDQHRAQITAEWIDTETGEIARSRVAPAHREPVRRFVARFAGRELEVALEATTGWRFVVEELEAAGARVHLAEPAQTSALRGNKKRPKTDRADARHLRELLMIGKLPECWIPPEHLLDLRARVGSVTRWSTTAANGSSGSTRCSTTTGSAPPRLGAAHRGGSRLARACAVARDRSRADHRRPCDDRRARPAAARA